MKELTFWYNAALAFRTAPPLIKALAIISVVGFMYCFAIVAIIYNHNFIINAKIIIQPKTTNTFTPIVYLQNKVITPVSEAILIEIINRRSVPAEIRSYQVEMKIGWKWVNLVPLMTAADGKFCWRSSEKSSLIDFGEMLYSQNFVGRMPKINPGESLTVWTFFTIPDEYKKIECPIGKMRLVIENSRGEKQKTLLRAENKRLDKNKIEYEAAFPLKIGALIDLSEYKIKP